MTVDGFRLFVVLSVIIAPHNVLIPHIRRTHLPIVYLTYVNSNRIGAQKTSQGKREVLLQGDGNASTSEKS